MDIIGQSAGVIKMALKLDNRPNRPEPLAVSSGAKGRYE